MQFDPLKLWGLQVNHQIHRLKSKAFGLLMRHGLESAAHLGKLLPYGLADRYNAEVVKDIPYQTQPKPDQAHLLDIYRPKNWRALQQAGHKLPVVLYIHGGGFFFLSKDTHWSMGLMLAQAGYLVFNINYQLAPKHPFPAALSDVAAAMQFIKENAAFYNGDLDDFMIAGESAGGNLTLCAAMACLEERPEAWAKQIYQTQLQPNVVMPACGFLQVSDVQRYLRNNKAHPIFVDRMGLMSRYYLRDATPDPQTGLQMADPLCVIEKEWCQPHWQPAQGRTMPDFFIVCGDADPIVDDTVRLHDALKQVSKNTQPFRLQAPIYERGIHAFHAVISTSLAQRCWRDTYAFLQGRRGQKNRV